MTAIRALVLTAGLLVAAAGVYLGWALTTESGYAAGGRVLKARYGFLAMPHAERQSLRKLAMMKAAGQCEWELDEAFWSRVYQLYVGQERGVRAAVYATLLDEQERYFLTDADHRRCQAAWARFGTAGADVPGILRTIRSEASNPVERVLIDVNAEATTP
ncbi:hypothetical protein [Methylobacterium sp. AMS5]|uniref:hypothetical protein n=1 Tax=Methylobacterium sp. AMS5 TaxID=925818 RepID=UPI00074F883B|nr:hypothetical protein [Methylobacterium sp. AMS5]AMB44483.1 hypothetical protein Y590_06225 [Methylobacterium sp. AMS5]